MKADRDRHARVVIARGLDALRAAELAVSRAQAMGWFPAEQDHGDLHKATVRVDNLRKEFSRLCTNAKTRGQISNLVSQARSGMLPKKDELDSIRSAAAKVAPILRFAGSYLASDKKDPRAQQLFAIHSVMNGHWADACRRLLWLVAHDIHAGGRPNINLCRALVTASWASRLPVPEGITAAAVDGGGVSLPETLLVRSTYSLLWKVDPDSPPEVPVANPAP